ncbi:MAG: hypothetical protein QXW56_09200 [Nitrososphaerota archaeon]
MKCAFLSCDKEARYYVVLGELGFCQDHLKVAVEAVLRLVEVAQILRGAEGAPPSPAPTAPVVPQAAPVMAPEQEPRAGPEIEKEIRWDHLRPRERAELIISHIAKALKLPAEVQEEAVSIMKTAYETNLTIGRPVEVVAAASIYLASRVKNYYLDLEDIVSHLSDRYRRMGRLVRRVYLEMLTIDKFPKPPTIGEDPKELVDQMVKRLELPESIAVRAKEILEGVRPASEGRPAKGYAAAAIYIAAKEAGMTVPTWRFEELSVTAELVLRRAEELLSRMHRQE